MNPESDSRLAEHLRWCQTRGLRPSTCNQRRLVIARFTSATGLDPLDASKEILEEWWYALTTTAKTRSVELSHLQSYFTWARRHGIIEGDPLSRIDRPRLPRNLPRPIGEDDLIRALELATARIRFMICIAAFCGLRCCEIAPVEWSHFSDTPDGPVLFVVEGKGARDRIVPVHEQVTLAMRALDGVRRGRVIRRADGKPGPVSPARISREINDHLHGLGIDDTAHSLRHRYGTGVFRTSKDIMLTKALMGHSSLNSTAGYVQWDASKAQDVISHLPSGRRVRLATTADSGPTPVR